MHLHPGKSIQKGPKPAAGSAGMALPTPTAGSFKTAWPTSALLRLLVPASLCLCQMCSPFLYPVVNEAGVGEYCGSWDQWSTGKTGCWDVGTPRCPAPKAPVGQCPEHGWHLERAMLPGGFCHPDPVRIHQTRHLAALPLSHAKAPRQEEINVETDEKVLIPRPGCDSGRRRGASPA